MVEGARRDPGIGCLDRTPFSLRGERDLGPFAAQLAVDRRDKLTCQMLGQFLLPLWPQSRTSDQRSNSASIIIPSNRPVMWDR